MRGPHESMSGCEGVTPGVRVTQYRNIKIDVSKHLGRFVEREDPVLRSLTNSAHRYRHCVSDRYVWNRSVLDRYVRARCIGDRHVRDRSVRDWNDWEWNVGVGGTHEATVGTIGGPDESRTPDTCFLPVPFELEGRSLNTTAFGHEPRLFNLLFSRKCVILLVP